MYSRLARRNERVTKRQSTLLLVGSVVFLILFVLYGFPAVLNFSGSLGSRFSKKTAVSQNPGLTPLTPRFSQDFEATKSAHISIHGVADNKISLEIFQNDQSQGLITAKDDGSFSIDVDLNRGNNIFIAQAVSDSGQKSPKSEPYAVSYLTSGPKLEINSPKDGENSLTGKTDPAVTVTVNDHFVVVASDGSFSYQLNLSPGENKIKIVASDRAGNQTTKELTISTTIP